MRDGKQSRTWRRKVAAAVVTAAGLAVGAGSPAGASVVQPPAKASVAAGAAMFPTAARAMARIAALDTWQMPTLSERDYRIAALVLEIAADVDPKDEELLRRLIEAEDSARRTDLVTEYTRRLVQLAPQDTVAQLRLISGRINALQDADARLAAYDNFLGPKGESIDASIRSRLALDAALLHRERGDLAAFARRLTQAINLDPSNKDAAALAVAFHGERSNDPVARVDMLLVLLKADPLDPETYLALARELSNAGAYKGALRMYKATADLASQLSLPADTGLLAEIHVAGWIADGARKKILGMQDNLESERSRIRERAELLKKQGNFVMKLPDPNEVQLDVPSARVLVAAASAIKDPDLTDWAIKELALAVKTATEPPPLRPGERRDETIKPMSDEDKRVEMADLLWMRLLSGTQLDEAEAQLKELRQDPAVAHDALERFEGWFLIRKGDLEGGRARLEPIAGVDSLAELGLGVANELSSTDPAAAAQWYQKFGDRRAGSIDGVWAWTRASTILGREPDRSPTAAHLEDVIAGIPSWLEGFGASARNFISLQADVGEIPSSRVQPVEKFPIRLRIRNISPIPLAIGTERPINARFLLTPTVWMGKDRVDDGTTMEVVSLARRLRLLPSEVYEVTVQTDNGWLWRKMEQQGDRELRLRWRAVQGFRMTLDRIAGSGPFGLVAETSVITRAAPAMAGSPPPLLRNTIQTGTPEQVVLAVQGAAARWAPADGKGGFSETDARDIAADLAARYAGLDASGRLMLLALLPPGARVSALTAFDTAVKNERDPDVLAFVLFTRVVEAADPLLVEAERLAGGGREGARLAELARLLRERMADGVRGYAHMTDGAAKPDRAAAPPAGAAPLNVAPEPAPEKR